MASSVASGSGLCHALRLEAADLNDRGLTKEVLSSYKSLGIDPDDYPALAEDADGLADGLEGVYSARVASEDEEDAEVDRYYLERAAEYLELHQQIESSGALLSSLSTFLSTFQGDLSSVSTSIASLQGRSKLIDARLDSRKQVEAALTPYLSSIILPPPLIHLLTTTAPSEAWLPAIETLEARLTALRSGARVPERKSLDDVAEALRVVAAYKIRDFLLAVLQPFRDSITPNLQITQASILRRYRALFAFLQRHAARVAHEVQKAYVGTVRWYFETGFRRYVRALEKVRARGDPRSGLGGKPDSEEEGAEGYALNASPEGGNVLLAYTADDPTWRQSPESLFRSLSVVFADNATSEYGFVTDFFGAPADPASDRPSLLRASQGSRMTSGGWDVVSRQGGGGEGDTKTATGRRRSVTSSADGAESVATGVAGWASRDRGRRKTAVDVVWKSIVEPMMEYHRTFTATVLSTRSPSTISLYTMIRLTDSLLAAAAVDCPPLESHLMSVKMQVWPPFQSSFHSTIDRLTKLASSSGSSAYGGGFFGGGGRTSKEAIVLGAAAEYTELFNALVALAPAPLETDFDPDSSTATSASTPAAPLAPGSLAPGESDKVFNDLLKVRQSLVALARSQASKAPTKEQGKAFLVKVFEGVSRDLMAAGRTSAPRCQAELAHWRELLRKVG